MINKQHEWAKVVRRWMYEFINPKISWLNSCSSFTFKWSHEIIYTNSWYSIYIVWVFMNLVTYKDIWSSYGLRFLFFILFSFIFFINIHLQEYDSVRQINFYSCEILFNGNECRVAIQLPDLLIYFLPITPGLLLKLVIFWENYY